jgi:hypothetical protein
MRFTTLLLFLLVQCRTTIPPEPEPEASLPSVTFETGTRSTRILFVGNSLTYSNNLPALVAELAAMDDVNVTYKMIAPGGFSLEDHWNLGEVQEEMSAVHYDLVVGQQGPSALPESQVLLKRYAEKYSQACARVKSSWALYMVWPSEERSFDLDNVIYSYTSAAKSTSALLFPAGLAWKLAWKQHSGFPLYGSDRFHPSIHGSLVAAMTIYATLQEKENFDFIDVEKASWKNHVSSEQLMVMKENVLKAIHDR